MKVQSWPIMQLYWLFLIPAIALAIFADKIDKAANANKKLKKWLIAVCVILALVSIVLIVKSVGPIS